MEMLLTVKGRTIGWDQQRSKNMSLNHHKMEQEFFKSLPSEVVIDILSRLPVRSVISCKCVQKSWLHLVETREFVKSHLSKSTPGVFICHAPLSGTNLYDIFELEDHDFIYKFVTTFNLTNAGWIMGSADGLLLLCMPSLVKKRDALYVCNPITRDYINLDFLPKSGYQSGDYGFGLSKMTKQYKVVRIFRDDIFNQEIREWQLSEAQCCVYTLGTRSWRRCAVPALLQDGCVGSGVFANGNLHWLVLSYPKRIFCFDLETERCSTFSAPPLISESSDVDLFAWDDCLGLSDRRSIHEIVIWVMKEDDGVEKSWTKELVLTLSNDFRTLEPIHPIKVFENGDVVIQLRFSLYYYSSTTKTLQSVDMPSLLDSHKMQAILYTPSFVSLKSFGLDVSSF